VRASVFVRARCTEGSRRLQLPAVKPTVQRKKLLNADEIAFARNLDESKLVLKTLGLKQ
jgi:hypothetical protein